MSRFDYIVAGAGSAGCVLANRLSADPNNSVLLIEAGGSDRNPMFHIPKGFGKLFDNEKYAWRYATTPFGPNQQFEYWPRGKVLGGSSSINGMVYNRGNRADYDELERLGNKDWAGDASRRLCCAIQRKKGSTVPLSLTTMGFPRRSFAVVTSTRIQPSATSYS